MMPSCSGCDARSRWLRWLRWQRLGQRWEGRARASTQGGQNTKRREQSQRVGTCYSTLHTLPQNGLLIPFSCRRSGRSNSGSARAGPTSRARLHQPNHQRSPPARPAFISRLTRVWVVSSRDRRPRRALQPVPDPVVGRDRHAAARSHRRRLRPPPPPHHKQGNSRHGCRPAYVFTQVEQILASTDARLQA